MEPRFGRVLVMDGGYDTQMAEHVGQLADGDPLWSARYNATNPAAVVQTHLDFMQNGADLIHTNTYQASVAGFMKHLQLDKEQSVELIRESVRLAHLAKQKYLKACVETNVPVEPGFPMILASIGPYADYMPLKEIPDWNRELIDICLEVGVDALAFETIPCQVEAEVLVKMLCDDYPQVKFYISFQCKDGSRLAHGEKFAEAAQAVWDILREHHAVANCLAVGVNCVRAMFVTPLCESVNATRLDDDKIPLLVYPNSAWKGREHYIPLHRYVPEWVNLGVHIIGGCCRTNASDIRKIAETVETLNAMEKDEDEMRRFCEQFI